MAHPDQTKDDNSIHPIEYLLNRKSAPVLQAPGPNAADLAKIMGAAVRPNDHRCLRPWRFLHIQGKERDRLGEFFAQAVLTDKPDASDEETDRIRNKCFRAPLIIVVIASPQTDSKVPEVEQMLSAGGAAQLITLAAYTLGYGSIWRTGAMAYHQLVHKQLGLTTDESIIGFVYIGTSSSAKAQTKIDYQDFTQNLSAIAATPAV